MTFPTNHGLAPPPRALPPPGDRKLKAKQFNERMKLLATSINTVGLGLAGSAVIIPFATAEQYDPGPWTLVWILAFLTLHCVAQAFLGLLRSED